MNAGTAWKKRLGFWLALVITTATGTLAGLSWLTWKERTASTIVASATPLVSASPTAPAAAPTADPSPAPASPTAEAPRIVATAAPTVAAPVPSAASLGDWAMPAASSPVDAGSGLPQRVVSREGGIEMVLVPAGRYERGTKPRDDRRRAAPDESPAHQVTISKPFYLGVTKVTQAQWTRVAGTNPSRFRKGGDFPVEGMSFADVAAFLRRLSLRLPTEAEWEYACKAGAGEPAADEMDAEGALADIAWYQANSGRSTQPVNLKRENAFGVKDMLGNVQEWTGSWYDAAEYYRSVPSVVDPRGPDEGSAIAIRGCIFSSAAYQCRCAARGQAHPRMRGFIGLRVAHDAP